MNHRKTNRNNPPTVWVNLLEEHDPRIARVRVFWRRGGQDYRPLILEDAAGDESDCWEPNEPEETHFEWSKPTDESPTERRAHLSETVETIWDTAKRWTRSQGVRCDFKLVAFDSVGETIFEDGKRCHPPGEPQDVREPAAEFDDTNSDEHAERFTYRRAAATPAAPAMDMRVSDFLDRLVEDRDKAMDSARDSLQTSRETLQSIQEAIDTAPKLLNKASEVMKETFDHQREQYRQLRDRNDGRLQMQAHALSEIERSQRLGRILDFGAICLEAGITHLVPMFNRAAEQFANRNMTVLPEFKRAQQAMAYLVITLTPTQLKLIFSGRMDSARTMMQALDVASNMDNEREALQYVAKIVLLLRSEKFRDIADPEQQLAARFIICRLAMYRMGEYAEEDPQEATA